MKFEFIVITSPEPVENEMILIERLFAAGLKRLHVRKPGSGKDELRNYLSMIPQKYHSRIVIHSHYSLLAEFTLGGVHLTEKTRKNKLPGGYNPGKHSLSASFHSPEQITNSRRKYDYVFLSPIFDSISKKGHAGGFKEAMIHKLLTEQKNVIALGGIDGQTLQRAQQMHFSGAATLGYIWKAKDPVKAFKTLRSKIK